MSFKWDPKQYSQFEQERLRPALDLLAQIDLDDPKRIYDLGCGPGNVTNIISECWPDSEVTGVDSSSEMLSKAGEDFPKIHWEQADLNEWQPETGCDLIFSNATLHWLPEHEYLIPHFVTQLNPGGVLAFQAPNNAESLAHQALFELAFSDEWKGCFENVHNQQPLLSVSEYYDLLSGGEDLKIWQTDYVHALAGENPVLEWLKGSALKPFLDALTDEALKQQFLTEYSNELLSLYPKQLDGKTLLTYKRLFVIVKRP